MKFNVNQQDLQQALNYCQGVIEKRSTLPILSNILLDARNSKLTITATDLDLIFIHQVNNVEILEEGKTTTTSSIMYDIIRKFNSGKKINLLKLLLFLQDLGPYCKFLKMKQLCSLHQQAPLHFQLFHY